MDRWCPRIPEADVPPPFWAAYGPGTDPHLRQGLGSPSWCRPEERRTEVELHQRSPGGGASLIYGIKQGGSPCMTAANAGIPHHPRGEQGKEARSRFTPEGVTHPTRERGFRKTWVPPGASRPLSEHHLEHRPDQPDQKSQVGAPGVHQLRS